MYFLCWPYLEGDVMMHRRDGKAYLDCLAFVAFEDTHDRFCPLRTLSIFQALVQPCSQGSHVRPALFRLLLFRRAGKFERRRENSNMTKFHSVLGAFGQILSQFRLKTADIRPQTINSKGHGRRTLLILNQSNRESNNPIDQKIE